MSKWSLGLFFLFASLGSQADPISGIFSYPLENGASENKAVTLTIDPDWEGPVLLQRGDQLIAASGYRLFKGKTVPSLRLIFTDVPETEAHTLLVLEGPYRGGKSYQGVCYQKTFPSEESKEEAMDLLLNQSALQKMPIKAQFQFTNVKPKANRRLDPSHRPEAHCCRLPYVAGFDRAIPYSMTREAQMWSQQIGVGKVRNFNQAHGATRMPVGILVPIR